MYHSRNRYGEAGAVPFRSGRFYHTDNSWWFAIRRGPDQGPYQDKPSARQALIDFLNDQFNFEKHLRNDRALLKKHGALSQ